VEGCAVEGGVSHFNGCKYFISVLLPTIAGIHVIAFYAEDEHVIAVVEVDEVAVKFAKAYCNAC